MHPPRTSGAIRRMSLSLPHVCTGGLDVHCNDGTSFSYILSSAYEPQTVTQPDGFTSISGLVGANTCSARIGMRRARSLVSTSQVATACVMDTSPGYVCRQSALQNTL